MDGGVRRGRGLALIGYRGTGKSTVGRILAERLGRPFFDADRELEKRLGLTVSAVFRTVGEQAFRDWEERILEELLVEPDAIVATGGGVVLREANRLRLRAFGTVVWLMADAPILARRLLVDEGSGAVRPALTPMGTLDEIVAVLFERTPLYRATSDLEVATDGKTPEEVADEVSKIVRDRSTFWTG
jgi:shikimate kinase